VKKKKRNLDLQAPRREFWGRERIRQKNNLTRSTDRKTL